VHCWQLVFKKAKSCTRWRCNFKRLSQHGGRAIFSFKKYAPRSLMTTYRMNLISAGSIPLNSIFKRSKDFYLPSLRLEEGERGGSAPCAVASAETTCICRWSCWRTGFWSLVKPQLHRADRRAPFVSQTGNQVLLFTSLDRKLGTVYLPKTGRRARFNT
jgi:hypothetical protein